MRKAEVYIQNRQAGTLEERDNGYLFTYDPNYLALQGAVAISLAMPLQIGAVQRQATISVH